MRKLLVLALLAAATLWAASATPAFTGPPVVNNHYKFTSDPYAENWCGQVEGTAVDTVVEHFMQDASGNITSSTTSG